MVLITVTAEQLSQLDLSPVTDWLTQTRVLHSPENLASPLATLETFENQLQFRLDFPREELDPREVSEIPDVRLWFLRLDSRYPWFPICLDWQSGELTRYTAMLVPHEFHRTEGIQFNPEALDLFIMQKVFLLADWLKRYEPSNTFRLQSFAMMFGYDLDEKFLAQL
ncbi:MAG: CRR6 family NdhI maturation factor [Synechocystis sp.]|nr:CRR6 family NdhI maturation factor [Synechocystis sp.]